MSVSRQCGFSAFRNLPNDFAQRGGELHGRHNALRSVQDGGIRTKVWRKA
jgi:hypothetical protein